MALTRSPRSAAVAVFICMASAGSALAHDGHDGHHGEPAFPVEAVTRDLPEQSVAFLKENNDAMTKMMAAMEGKPSGDIDRDFVEMMIPHHQGAIDMAKAVLRFSHNGRVRRLAQEIIVTQQQEIAAMRLAIGDPLPASYASPTQIRPVP